MAGIAPSVIARGLAQDREEGVEHDIDHLRGSTGGRPCLGLDRRTEGEVRRGTAAPKVYPTRFPEHLVEDQSREGDCAHRSGQDDAFRACGSGARQEGRSLGSSVRIAESRVVAGRSRRLSRGIRAPRNSSRRSTLATVTPFCSGCSTPRKPRRAPVASPSSWRCSRKGRSFIREPHRSEWEEGYRDRSPGTRATPVLASAPTATESLTVHPEPRRDRRATTARRRPPPRFGLGLRRPGLSNRFADATGMIPREGCAVVAVAAVTACSPVRRLETPEWAPKGEQSSVSSSVALPEGLRFEANLGQFDPRVQYIARVHGGALVLDDQARRWRSAQVGPP